MNFAALWLAAGLLLSSPDPGIGAQFGDALLRTKHFRFEYFEVHEKAVKKLADRAERIRIKHCELIEACPDEVITVRVARDEDEFLALQPYHSHIDWASGVAYEEFSLVILRLDKQMLLDMEQTFEHEVSHILLLKATGSRPPRWFIEGLAIIQADQDLIQRFETVAASTISGGPIPFSKLDVGFPSSDQARNLAYAQSGLFVSYLVSRFGDDNVKELITAQAYGMSFDDALKKVFDHNLAGLEEAWKSRLGSWGWLYALVSDWMLWTLISILFLVAVAVKLRRAGRRRRQMEREEADWEYRQTGVPPAESSSTRILH